MSGEVSREDAPDTPQREPEEERHQHDAGIGNNSHAPTAAAPAVVTPGDASSASTATTTLHSWSRRREERRRRGRRRSLFRQRPSREEVAADLGAALAAAAVQLVDRLVRYLSSLPSSSSAAASVERREGLTLPASAAAWLAMHLFPDCDDDAPVSTGEGVRGDNNAPPSVRRRLSVLKVLLRRARSVRITSDPWPSAERRNDAFLPSADNNGDVEAAAEEEPPSPSTLFIEYYDSLVNRPVVDMRLFPRCQILLLDRVPIEWISHLAAVQHSLQLLRVDRSCIYSMSSLFPVEGSFSLRSTKGKTPRSCGEDPLAAPSKPATEITFPALTHVKLSNCCLGEQSGLRGRRLRPNRKESPALTEFAEKKGFRRIPPPLSQLYHLRSLSLSHNELRTEQTALAGLRNLPFLMKLDLSYNRLTSLEKAHYRLGNIQTLLLSHNQLTSVRGLDRLLALETLWLDHNQLANLTDVSGLAGLPELKELRLEGNPLQLVNKKAFRVDVLNLFKERRLSSLPSGATYGDLQRILPILDGWQASLKELKALRQRTFVVADVHVRLSRDGPLLQQEGTGVLPNQSIDASATPKAPSVCSGSSRSQRRRRKMAVIGESAEATEGNGATGKRSLGRNDRIPEVGFTVDDVLRSLSETVELAEDEEREETDQGQEQEELDAKQREAKAGNIGIKYLESASFFVAAETEVKKEAQPSSVSKLNGAPSQATTEAATDFPTEKEENASSTEIATPLRRAVEEESDELVSIRQIDMPVAGAELGNLSLSMINTEDDSPELKASAATTATTAETHADESPGEVSSPTNVPVTPTSSKKTAVGLGLERQPLTPFSSGSSVQATPPDHVRLNIRATSIPGSLFQEDNESTTSSLMATEIRDNTSLTKLFLRAEASSTYDGPLSSYKLRICDNIELYFRLFVFAPHEADSSVGDWIEGYEWRHALQHYPRIQLWPVDRRVREFVQADQSLFKLEESREEFRRVWREKVVPCGKPALRRLTPNRDVRFGFHGELLWSAADSSQLKPETVVECREAIVCLSTTAFYIIADHDKVTEKLQDQKRKFPVPIPKDATFKDAKWPHALARHPFACLEGITIGFGFQRLTLHFSVDPNKVGYTYILLTSNKMQTVALLREIQEMVREAAGPKEHSITIENDDRHVLDALGVAVAPDVVDVVQHYQILQQQWKHGDRGAVRRVCVVTDDKLFLLDEDYAGDGSESMEVGAHKQLGESTYRLVDSAALEQITEIKAADANPTTITISFKSNSYLRRRTHNWRLVCRDGQGAERLVEDVRKAMSFAAHGKANPFAL